LVGCQSEKLVDEGGSQDGQQFSLTASRGVQSRTHLGDPYEDNNGKKILPMYWTEGDRIYVSSKDGRVTGTLTLTSEPGKPTGTFTGFVFGDPADLYYSIYPVPDGGKVDLSTLTGREIRTPMVGTISANNNVAFDNTCGMMVVENLDYKEGDETTASFKLFAGIDTDQLIPLAATAEIEKDENGVVIVDAEGNVSLKYTSKADAQYINLADAEFIEGKLYIPYDLKSNATKENIHFYIQSGNGEKQQITTSTVDLREATIGKPLYAGAKILVDDEGNVKKVPNKVINADNTSSNQATVEVAADENAVNIPSVPEEVKNVTIEMPIQLSDNKKAAIVAIEEIKSNDAVITITSTSTESSDPDAGGDNSTTATASQIEEMTVILPSNATQEQVEQRVIIDMPNTTVTVKSDDGNVLFIKEMTAATAPSTLVVEKDVEIKTLIIKQGNVQVFGKVGEIKRDDNNADEVTVVTIEKGGIVNEVDGNEIEVVDRNIPSETPEKITVSTFTQLKSAIESQPLTEITMIDVTADITLTEPLVINKRVQMNLKGNSLKIVENFAWGNAEAAITSNANLHLSGGNIKGCDATAEGKYLLRSTEIVNLYNVSLKTNGVSNGFSQINKIAHFRGASSITATRGNAIHVLINKTEIGALGVQLWDTTQINGSIAFELTCEPVEKAYVAVCLLDNSKLNGQLDIIKNGYESYVEFENRSTGGNESSDTEATPVDTETKLIEAVKDAKVTKIRLTAPITVENLTLKHKTLIIDPNIFNGSTANAAITIVSNEEAQIVDGIITGDIEDNNKYIIESTAPTLGILNATIIATGGVNAVRVEDSSFTLNTLKDTPKVIPTTITCDEGYALHMVAENSAVYANIFGGTTINGKIHYSNNTYNCNSSEDLEMSCIQVEGTINGDLTVAGDYGKDLNKIIGENAVIGEEFTTWRTVEVSGWKQLNVATLDKNITNIVIAAPIEVDEGGVNLQGKTLTLKENFVFGNHSAALYGNVGGLSNGTFRGSTTETNKYLIATGSELHLQSSMVLNAGGTLNGVKVTDAGCAVYGNSSITVESGKTAVKIESTKAVAGLGMWNSAVVKGNVLITANYTPQNEEGGCWIELNNRDIPYDFGKIYGNVTIDGTNSSTVEIFIPEDKITDYITGNITGSYKKVIAKYEN